MSYRYQDIARVTGTPEENWAQSWPALEAAMRWKNVYTPEVARAVIATVVVETGVTVNGKNMTGLPVVEQGVGPSAPYWPFIGRGLVQRTWENAYRADGAQLDPPVDLIANPDLLVTDMRVSAQDCMLFFVNAGIIPYAQAGNEYEVRVRVNGGTNGWAVYDAAWHACGALVWNAAPPVTRVAIQTILRTTPAANGKHAINPQHQSVLLQVGQVVTFTPDPSPGKYHGMTTTPSWAHCALPNTPIHGWAQRANLQTTAGG
jgi:predicted chitinase